MPDPIITIKYNALIEHNGVEYNEYMGGLDWDPDDGFQPDYRLVNGCIVYRATVSIDKDEAVETLKDTFATDYDIDKDNVDVEHDEYDLFNVQAEVEHEFALKASDLDRILHYADKALADSRRSPHAETDREMAQQAAAETTIMRIRESLAEFTPYNGGDFS